MPWMPASVQSTMRSESGDRGGRVRDGHGLAWAGCAESCWLVLLPCLGRAHGWQFFQDRVADGCHMIVRVSWLFPGAKAIVRKKVTASDAVGTPASRLSAPPPTCSERKAACADLW